MTLPKQSQENLIATSPKCLVEYNGWFRRIIRGKDVRVISKTKEFMEGSTTLSQTPNKIEIQANGQFITLMMP